MRAGALKYLATYQTPIRTSNSKNELTITGWTNALSINISLDTLKAWEIIKTTAVQLNITHRISCRYSPLISATGRFAYQNRTFDIFSVNNVENRNRELEILANEIQKPT